MQWKLFIGLQSSFPQPLFFPNKADFVQIPTPPPSRQVPGMGEEEAGKSDISSRNKPDRSNGDITPSGSGWFRNWHTIQF